ncbi:MAG: maltooligosyltrehalose trehalohydrolase [Gaiellales bacterium]|nr:maltooligosyltrehalose trehalohydrolase [Gaiellales bacterium]
MLHLLEPDRLIPMERDRQGYFEATAEAEAGARYGFRLDGGDDLPDPASRWQPYGVHGPSALVDPAAFEWSDGGFRAPPLSELVIYELHIGTFSEAGSFDGAIERLDDLVSLGVTACEIMPVGQFPGARNWGYDGVDLWAPQSTYGGPDGLRRLVDACHARGLAVVLDVVYNHFGPEGNYLERFAPYLSDLHHTPWGQGVNVDGPGSDEVRRFFIGNALHWLDEYHIDALRLDAIHGILDTSAVPFLRELGLAVAELGERRRRTLTLIAESDLNDPRVVQPAAIGGLGLDSAWCDDLHHSVHAALTGERDGYYSDFGTLRDLAKALRQGWVYDGAESVYRGRRYGGSPSGLDGKHFVVFSQNHDQVGNRALGDRLTRIVDAERQKLAAGLVLLSPFVPLLFMGEEYGETAPFLYFTDHRDDDLNTAVREGRAREFEAFARSGELVDPHDPEAFLRSRLDWTRREQGAHRQHLDLYRELLRLRRDLAPLARLSLADASVTAMDDADLIVLRRRAAGEEVLVGFHLGDGESRPVPLPDAGWRQLIDSADTRFGGPGGSHLQAGGLVLAPSSFVALERTST